PYVRHHHLDPKDKQRLRLAAIDAADADVNGLAGLYCYFVALSHAWMAKDALAIWLIPSEFMDVNYGRALKEYLLKRVTLLRIHRFDPAEVQFDDALVSSAIVVYRNAEPRKGHVVEFTFGGTLAEPGQTRARPIADLLPETKWTGLAHARENRGDQNGRVKLADLFTIKRGIATGANDFFLLAESRAEELDLPRRFLRPILPSPRFVRTDEVEADDKGNPQVEPRLLLLDCRLPEDKVRHEYPGLWSYLQTGRARGIHERYLCTHRQPWYAQEDRDASPILCTYMGRTAHDRGAFRFILNHSKAIAANVYLMLYPKPALARILHDRPELLRTVWAALNEIPSEALLGVGRVYGGGLHKMEPGELAEAPASTLLRAVPAAAPPRARQLTLSW
ncbi:MAG TPA: SAM-dependent DNA methyltransferase, partial [Phycisphaerae bacterium]|nr:SAM-dependent DNA methyltransferase [Phycisphaerae bacterium]